tara:strand:+ start:1052 stop:1864 length:813 start_codon:yes stop_codon:yes gene_type:complete
MAEAEQQVEQSTEPPKGLMATVEVENETNQDPESINENNISHTQNDEPKKEIAERPEHIPEKFWDAKTGKVREEEAFKSLQSLEQKFSQGKHKVPETYDTEVLTSKGYDLEDPMVETYVNWCKSNGVNQNGFEDLANKIIGLSGQTKENYEYEEKAELEKLGNNADAIIKSNKQWANSLVTKGQLSEEERAEIDVLGYTASGQRTIQKLRAMMGDTRQIPVGETSSLKESESEFSVRMANMMADPKYGNDPAYTRSVEQEYEKRYPNKSG